MGYIEYLVEASPTLPGKFPTVSAIGDRFSSSRTRASTMIANEQLHETATRGNSMDNTLRYRVRTLALILGLGGLIGVTDPWLSDQLQPITVFPFFGGITLWLVLPYLLLTKNVRAAMIISVVAAGVVFIGCFASYGDPFYIMLGFGVPIGAALFLRTADACWILFVYCFAAVLLAAGIRAEWFHPPYLAESANTALGLKQTVTGASIIIAMTVAAIWKEKLFTDPTAREKRQKNLLETICEHGYDAILEADDRGNISFCSGKLIEEFGFCEAELIQKQQLSFFEPAARRKFLRELKLENNRFQVDCETTILDARGMPRWVRISGGSFQERDDSRHWVYGVRNIEEQVRQREQLYEVARLESLGSVCAGLAHDFNNLLTVIGIQADLVKQPETRSTLLLAQKQATRLTSGLLTFARKQEFREQRVNLSKFFQDAASLIGTIVPETIRLLWQIEGYSAAVLVDPAQLQQALVNLVTNSQHALPAGGQVCIWARKVDVLPDVCVQDAVPGKSYIAIGVRDDGHGMTPQVARRAVEPFYTTKPRGKGTGLGLAMVHGIIRRAGGFLNIESETGKGTEVTIFLPVIDSKDRSGVQPDVPRDLNIPQIEANILVVEDQELVANSIATTLELTGARVRRTDNAERAAEMLVEDGQFDLVISDVVLPGQSGLELIQIVLEKFVDLHAILISGQHRENLDVLHQHRGRVSFLAKPFGTSSLLSLVIASCQRNARSSSLQQQ